MTDKSAEHWKANHDELKRRYRKREDMIEEQRESLKKVLELCDCVQRTRPDMFVALFVADIRRVCEDALGEERWETTQEPPK